VFYRPEELDISINGEKSVYAVISYLELADIDLTKPVSE